MFSANIERWPLERLIPHARNARTHSEEQVAQIAGSIAEFGFVNPVLVGDDGVIVAGHGRVHGRAQAGTVRGAGDRAVAPDADAAARADDRRQPDRDQRGLE